MSRASQERFHERLKNVAVVGRILREDVRAEGHSAASNHPWANNSLSGVRPDSRRSFRRLAIPPDILRSARAGLEMGGPRWCPIRRRTPPSLRQRARETRAAFPPTACSSVVILRPSPLARSTDTPARPIVSTGVSLLVPSPGDDPDAPFRPERSRRANVITVRHWRRLLDGLLLARSPRLDWATLLRRNLNIDALACPRCAGRLRALDVVTNADEARRILLVARLRAEAPPLARARDPTDE